MKQHFEVPTQEGPVSGIVGRASAGSARQRNLLIAIHGGTYNSAYFDIPGSSLIDRAMAAGFDIVALDRPGYGTTRTLDDGPAMLDRNATRISAVLPELLLALGLPAAGIVLIGHSMGGVIASTIAASQPSWTLKGIAGTGFAQHLPRHLAEGFAALPQQYSVELPTEMKDQLMFGPPDTLDATMPGASHAANTSMPRAEAIDIAFEWGGRAPGILKGVTVPVYYKLAEFEKLWDIADREAFAGLYSHAPGVETGVFIGAGHCIDFHKRGASFHDELLRFAATV
ncbi:thioesterase [Mesorhizobium sp. L-8-10]|uniref:alpha/beta hydrolase n=1 Tax=Mesorhizobium sp. L-8-10 TaxID=2744523 RepID=UPI001925279A|nr:alpha/beta hydrolase [Mesorhizobium sp. L-8-10]BCH28551.1 thioesterase [Mesorhizobium sp. L-8-10]